jgi:glycosyltransferase involved in cell wall biosynthesis
MSDSQSGPSNTSLPLEIMLYTYNRAELLANTLEQLAASPFRDCPVTLLDNHSTDATPAVCERFKHRFPHLRVIRHPKNIGGDANYLRAVELSQGEYTWPMCDDDTYDFSAVADVIEALRQRKFDLISVGVEGHNLPAGYQGSARDLAMAHPFFICHSFIPSMIFRTALFDSAVLRRAYNNLDTLFPQLAWLSEAVERNISVYVSRQKVIRKGVNMSYSSLYFLTSWIKCCRRIREPRMARRASAEIFKGKALTISLVFAILTEKAFRPKRFWKEYRELCAEALLFRFTVALKVLIFLPLALCPKPVHRWLWRRYKTYREKRGMTLPNFDEER